MVKNVRYHPVKKQEVINHSNLTQLYYEAILAKYHLSKPFTFGDILKRLSIDMERDAEDEIEKQPFSNAFDQWIAYHRKGEFGKRARHAVELFSNWIASLEEADLERFKQYRSANNLSLRDVITLLAEHQNHNSNSANTIFSLSDAILQKNPNLYAHVPKLTPTSSKHYDDADRIYEEEKTYFHKKMCSPHYPFPEVKDQLSFSHYGEAEKNIVLKMIRHYDDVNAIFFMSEFFLANDLNTIVANFNANLARHFTDQEKVSHFIDVIFGVKYYKSEYEAARCELLKTFYSAFASRLAELFGTKHAVETIAWFPPCYKEYAQLALVKNLNPGSVTKQGLFANAPIISSPAPTTGLIQASAS